MADEPTTPVMRGDRAGEQIESRYRLLQLIGRGGMGEVYEAEHLQVGRRVAVKLLSPDYARDPQQIERFEREARVASLATSPHMVDVLDAGSLADGTRYFVMELLRGVTLTQELEAHGTFSFSRTGRLGRQIATGLHAAHVAGIVHRDLKPDNVFLVAQPDHSDHVKILDFGVSKVRAMDTAVDLTRTGMAIGTPTYMSPEQSEGARDIDGRADIWSLGVILYRMLTGELPFVAPNYARLVIKIVTEAPPFPRTHRAEIPLELERIVLRCLEKSPADRFASAADLIAAIAAWEADPGAVLTAEVPVYRRAAVQPGPALAGATRVESWSDSATRIDRHTPTAATATPTPTDPPFDQVVLTGPDGERRMSAAAFFELPLSERIRLVIARTVTFMRAGVEIERVEALARMRVRAARSGARRA